MLHKIFISLILISYGSQAYSQSDILGIFSSHPNQIVTSPESQDFLVGNLIHPLSGQICLRQTDLAAKGAQSIELKRAFISN